MVYNGVLFFDPFFGLNIECAESEMHAKSDSINGNRIRID